VHNFIIYHRWQDVARKIDTFIYPDEPDVPGLTFLTPIEWAPWMETIWYAHCVHTRTSTYVLCFSYILFVSSFLYLFFCSFIC
jgi:hypothetical protein